MTTIKNLYKALFILSAIFVMVFSVAGIASADFYQGSCQGGNCGGPICDSLGGGRRDLGQITYGGFTCSGTNYERQVGYYTGVAGINGWADKVWCYVNEISEDCATSGKVCSSTGCVTNTPTPTPTPNIACATNSQCGTNSLTGGLFCQGNNVYQNYITYTCNNPGTASSSCTNSTTPQLQTTCSGTQICTNGSCTNNCTSNYQQRCQGNNLYWYDSCGNQQNFIQYCPNGCNGNSCQNYINTCTYHSYERCNGNNLYWYDSCGTQQDLVQYCPNGCYGNSCQNYYNNNGTLTVTKTVRDLTTGSGFSNSTYASPSDMLMFMITLQSTGQDVQNVLVRDTLPANLIYSNQLVVACTGNGNYNNNCNSNNYNYSGSIINGISLNTIYAGQTVTITYQVQVASAVNFSYGTTTLNNSVSVTSSQSGYTPTSNASVVVTRSTVLGASTVSTGLTNNFWVDSFFLPLLITLILLWMWKAGMFLGIEKWLDTKKKVRRGYRAERELSARIQNIQKTGR